MKCIIAKNQKEIVDNFIIRSVVFIKEQNVEWELEFDYLDDEATLFTVYDNEKAIGAGRVRITDNCAKAERICVLKEMRGKHVGKLIMDKLEDHAKSQNADTVKLGAQMEAVPFYKALGYNTYGDTFLDANIVHIMMKKRLL